MPSKGRAAPPPRSEGVAGCPYAPSRRERGSGGAAQAQPLRGCYACFALVSSWSNSTMASSISARVIISDGAKVITFL